ncbi:MAG: LppX_LprAFG lipoprotein [Micromonosporaceae bacterium]|jgi:lipoprotein LprG|nr:LppX_LprAFG lipoprotein [Micromonosporaceae bacterium]
MRRRVLLVPAVTVLLAALAGCSGDKKQPAGDLPAGDELVRSAAEAMRSVRTAHFEITSDGTVAGIPLRKATGAITATGDAEGSAQIDQSGPLAELSFVVKGQTLYVKAVTGGWQKVPLALASSVYDPSKILSPDQGVANVLATATGAKTEAREQIRGADAYRVKATFSGEALSRLVPGIDADVPGQVWIGADRHVLHQGKFRVPAEGGGDPATVTVTFSDFDAPVTVDEP